LITLARNSFLGSFLSEAEKAEQIARLEEYARSA
jgi:adenosine deaminase